MAISVYLSLGIRSQMPRVSYIKAIDVWMSACLVFVFAGLLEYALVNVIARKGELKQQVRFSKEVSNFLLFSNGVAQNREISGFESCGGDDDHRQCG